MAGSRRLGSVAAGSALARVRHQEGQQRCHRCRTARATPRHWRGHRWLPRAARKRTERRGCLPPPGRSVCCSSCEPLPLPHPPTQSFTQLRHFLPSALQAGRCSQAARGSSTLWLWGTDTKTAPCLPPREQWISLTWTQEAPSGRCGVCTRKSPPGPSADAQSAGHERA